MTNRASARRDRSITPHCIAAAAVAVVLLLTTSGAGAQETLPPPAEASTTYAIGPQAYIGGFSGSGSGGMPLVGVSLLGRYGAVEGGALYEGGSQIFGASMTGSAGLLGVGFDPTRHFHLSLLGEAGYHQYTSVGGELFGQPGSSGNLPYAGARAGFQFGFGGDVRFTLGLWLFVRDDLGRKHESVTYDAGWFEEDMKTATNDIGQWQTGVVLRLGVEGGSF